MIRPLIANFLYYKQTLEDSWEGDEFTVGGLGLRRQYRALQKAFDNKPPLLYDRTGTIPHYIDFVNKSPMPIEGTSRSIKEIAVERARELIALNKPIKVFWSGGVDSTSMMVAFLLAGADKLEREQFEVYLTRAGIIEYENFFRRFVYPLPHRLIRECDSQISTKDYPTDFSRRTGYFRADPRVTPGPEDVWVVGEVFNCLFGPLNTNSPNYYTRDDLHHKDVIPGDVVEFLEPYTKRAPLDISIYKDYVWWVMFGFTWNLHKYRFSLDLPIRPTTSIEFCDTLDYQRWAITNHYAKHVGRNGEFCYKYPMKQYIIEYTKDEDYYYMGKKGSMPYEMGWQNPESRLYYRYLLEDGNKC